MEHKGNVEYEKIEIAVTSDGGETTFDHTTEIDHNRIIGITQVFSDSDALPDSTLELDVDGEEIFPAGFESKLIATGQEVPPDDKWVHYIDRPVKQVRVTGKFTDGSALSSFAAYKANIYLMMRTDKYDPID